MYLALHAKIYSSVLYQSTKCPSALQRVSAQLSPHTNTLTEVRGGWGLGLETPRTDPEAIPSKEWKSQSWRLCTEIPSLYDSGNDRIVKVEIRLVASGDRDRVEQEVCGILVSNGPVLYPDQRSVKNLLGFDSWVRKISWRRKWQPTPIFLPGESHEQRSLVG